MSNLEEEQEFSPLYSTPPSSSNPSRPSFDVDEGLDLEYQPRYLRTRKVPDLPLTLEDTRALPPSSSPHSSGSSELEYESSDCNSSKKPSGEVSGTSDDSSDDQEEDNAPEDQPQAINTDTDFEPSKEEDEGDAELGSDTEVEVQPVATTSQDELGVVFLGTLIPQVCPEPCDLAMGCHQPGSSILKLLRT